MYGKDVERDEDRAVELNETVGDMFEIIHSEPATVPTTATIRDVVDAILKEGDSSKAYVVDEEGKLVGTITMDTLMRQIAYRVGARPPGIISFIKFLNAMEIEDVSEITTDSKPVRRETRVIDVIRKVVEHKLNDFPIVDDEGKLIGELSTMNLLRAMRGVFPKGGKKSENA